jgi:hypothetical protein
MIKTVTDTDRDEDGMLHWVPAMYSALYIYRSTKHSATGVSRALLVYGEELKLPFEFDNSVPANQIQHPEQVAARLEALRATIPGLRNAQYRYVTTKEGFVPCQTRKSCCVIRNSIKQDTYLPLSNLDTTDRTLSIRRGIPSQDNSIYAR